MLECRVGLSQEVSNPTAAWRTCAEGPSPTLPILASPPFVFCLIPFHSVVDSQKALGTNKKIDLFEPARLDDKHSIEEVVTSLKTLRDEGLFSYIGLSEVSAETLKRAYKVCLFLSFAVVRATIL